MALQPEHQNAPLIAEWIGGRSATWRNANAIYRKIGAAPVAQEMCGRTDTIFSKDVGGPR